MSPQRYNQGRDGNYCFAVLTFLGGASGMNSAKTVFRKRLSVIRLAANDDRLSCAYFCRYALFKNGIVEKADLSYFAV